MENRIEIKLNRSKCYDIIIEPDYGMLAEEVSKLFPGECKACIFTDSNVLGLYSEEIRERLKDCFTGITVFSFEAGEENKNLKTIEKAYSHLIENKFNRQDVIIALGGGVCGDMAGYTAATYLRGISFVQIPTTLLSQVDSSIGGKVGVDFKEYKNMVGAFHMPKLVYINPSVLSSLPDREYASGMAEILKAGLIKDGPFYEWLINNFNEINEKEYEYVSEMIYKSLIIKKEVVEKDPYEKGERALLNFGHTLGHAIEKYLNFEMTHGECVALGSVAAAYISWRRDMISMEDYYEIRDMFVPFSLPISLYDIDTDRIIEYTKNDKKNDNKGLKFILLKKIGRAVADRDVTEEELKDALKELDFSNKEQQ